MMQEKDRTEQNSIASDKIYNNLADYSALTLDTSVVREIGYNFNNSLLVTLKNQSIPVILSEVVDMEIIKHLYEQRDNAVIELKKANHELYRKNIITEDEFNEMQVKPDEIDNKDPCALFEKFKSVNNIIVIKADLCLIKNLITIYFNSKPPFNKKNKKNEFPDAIALLSLEEWAKTNDKKILAFSKDEDWMTYSKNSKHIFVAKNLEFGLGKIRIFEDNKKKIINLEKNSSSADEKKDKIEGFIFNIKHRKNKEWVKIIDEFLISIDTKSYIPLNNFPPLRIGALLNFNLLEVKYHPGNFNIPENEESLKLFVLPSQENTAIFIVTLFIDVTSIVEVTSHFDSYDIGSTHRVKHYTLNCMNIPIRVMFTLDENVLVENDNLIITNISINNDIQIIFNYKDLFNPDEYDDNFDDLFYLK